MTSVTIGGGDGTSTNGNPGVEGTGGGGGGAGAHPNPGFLGGDGGDGGGGIIIVRYPVTS